jgi:hypothetical protein
MIGTGDMNESIETKRGLAASVVLVALFIVAFATARASQLPSLPAPSPALLAALQAIRSGPMADVVLWAGGAQPAQSDALQAVEAQVMALAPPDRDALIFWLAGHGRAPLHAQGASDAQIGVPFYAIDYAVVPAGWPATVAVLPSPKPVPTPTPAQAPKRRSNFLGMLAGALATNTIPLGSSSSSSSSTTTSPDGSETVTQSSSSSVSASFNPGALVGSLIDANPGKNSAPPPSSWRGLQFAASSVGSEADASHIAVTHGFASARYDGTQGFACISFTNNAAQPAIEVDVDFEILDGFGFLKRVVPLRRTGSFVPGVEVSGPSTPADVKAGRPNCVVDGEGAFADPSDPFAGASTIVYSVREVKYADGSSWILPGANPWPLTLARPPA